MLARWDYATYDCGTYEFVQKHDIIIRTLENVNDLTAFFFQDFENNIFNKSLKSARKLFCVQ